VNTMNEPTTSGTPPSVEGIESRLSPFAAEETLERLKAVIGSHNLTLFAWQSADGQVWVSTNSIAYLSERYDLPQELVGPLAVVDAVIEQALTR
jgi:hypothetical protein